LFPILFLKEEKSFTAIIKRATFSRGFSRQFFCKTGENFFNWRSLGCEKSRKGIKEMISASTDLRNIPEFVEGTDRMAKCIELIEVIILD